MSGALTVLAFRGHGIMPVLIRLFCWHWRQGQRWSEVPAHVAIWDEAGAAEYEAIVTGIKRSELASLDGLRGLTHTIRVEVPDMAGTRVWLEEQVGREYGYLAVAATGLGILSPPSLDRVWRCWWERLSGGKSGRTAPLDCSLLAQMALRAGGVEMLGRRDGLPVSPNDLVLELKGRAK